MLYNDCECAQAVLPINTHSQSVFALAMKRYGTPLNKLKFSPDGG